MFSPLRQAASAQPLNQGIGKNSESKVWILNIWGWSGGSVKGRGLEIVTMPSSHSEAKNKWGGPWVAATREDNLKD